MEILRNKFHRFEELRESIRENFDDEVFPPRAYYKSMNVSAQDLGSSSFTPPGLSVPLAFDRINEGRPFNSGNFIFARLPVEITWQILKFVAQTDLARLALVNKDCRQLARSRQFSTITLDHSESSLGILNLLLQEAKERHLNQGKTRIPSLGACVRHIIMSTSIKELRCDRFVEPMYGVEWDEFKSRHYNDNDRNLEHTYEEFFCRYLPDVYSVLSDSCVLPHLTSIDWDERYAMDQQALKAIFLSRAQHIKFHRLQVKEGCKLGITQEERCAPIKSLYLRFSSRASAEHNEGISPLLLEIMDLASSTLESLVWDDISFNKEKPSLSAHSLDSRPRFPKLRNIRILRESKYTTSWLPIFIRTGHGSPVHYLEVNNCMDQGALTFYKTCILPRLNTLVWHHPDENQFDISILRNNPQVQKLMIAAYLESCFLDHVVLPSLSQSFHHLTSLSLVWWDDHISQHALNIISTLSSLEQLSLAVGSLLEIDRSFWIIDHVVLRASLASLGGLRKLALIGDTYQPYHDLDFNCVDPQYYYNLRRPRTWPTLQRMVFYGEEEDSTFDAYVERAWQEQHRQDMLVIADQYVKLLEKLDWLFLGQLAMCVEHGGDRSRKAVLLSPDIRVAIPEIYQIFGPQKGPIF